MIDQLLTRPEGKTLVGANPQDEAGRLCDLIANGISPRLVPNVELVNVTRRTLLVAEIFSGNSRQHHLSSPGPEQGVFVRLGSSNRQAGLDRVAETHRAGAGQVIDEQPVPNLSIDDLNLPAMDRMFEPGQALKTKQRLHPK